MNGPGGDPRGDLGAGIAGILRVGTILSVVVIGVGFVVASMTGLPTRGPRPLPELVLRAGPDAPIAIGLFAMTLLPLVAVAYAALVFARHGERRELTIALGVLGLLLAGLAVAAVVSTTS